MSMRIAVVGNCQAIGLAHTLRWLCPDIAFEDRNWGLFSSIEEADAFAEHITGHDIVISQITKQPAYGALRSVQLQPRVKRMALYPKIAFTGFHPDLIRLKDVFSPLRERHSSLIAAAYLLGLPQARVADLFNAYIYAVAGFFAEYAKAEAYLAHTTRKLFADCMGQWKAQGVFVHVPNHPTGATLVSMARTLATDLGLETRPDGDAPDDIFEQSVIWPVYPELARRIGVSGGMRFKPLGLHAVPVELDEMIERSYRAYAEADPEVLRAPRVVELAEILRREGV